MINSKTKFKVDAVWISAHQNSKGKWIRGHWRTPPRVINVKGHFRNLSYIKPHKRKRPYQVLPVEFTLGGQPQSIEHTLINILKDVEPIMGY